MFSVYLATGPNGSYVGKTSNFARRLKEHRYAVRRPQTQRQAFARALALYGFEAFSWQVVLQTKDDRDALLCETQIIAQERAAGTRLYNVTDGGEGCAGYKQSEQHKEKKVAARRGRPVSEAEAERLRSYNRNRGPVSEETRRKMSESRKRHIALHGHNLTGHKMSEQSRINISNGVKKRRRGV